MRHSSHDGRPRYSAASASRSSQRRSAIDAAGRTSTAAMLPASTSVRSTAAHSATATAHPAHHSAKPRR
jgi:hypothetical protein